MKPAQTNKGYLNWLKSKKARNGIFRHHCKRCFIKRYYTHILGVVLLYSVPAKVPRRVKPMKNAFASPLHDDLADLSTIAGDMK